MTAKRYTCPAHGSRPATEFLLRQTVLEWYRLREDGDAVDPADAKLLGSSIVEHAPQEFTCGKTAEEDYDVD